MATADNSRNSGKPRNPEQNRNGSNFNRILGNITNVTTKVDQVAKGVQAAGNLVQFAMAAARLLKNHPEWLTHTKALPTGLDYGLDRSYPITLGAEFDAGSSEMNSMSTVQIMVQRIGLTNAVPTDPQQKYRQAMLTLRDSLISSSGRAGYSVEYLSDYLQNVRAVYALLASLTRAWQCTFASDANDAELRRTLLLGCDMFSYDGNESAPAEVRDLLASFWSRLSAFPVVGDIFDSTIYMFSNIFMDAPEGKPTYIMNQPYRPMIILNSTVQLSPQFAGWKENDAPITRPNLKEGFAAMVEDVSKYLSLLESEYSEDTLRSDLKRVYGMDKAKMLCDHTRLLSNPIPAPIATFDEYLLRQIQNSVSLSYQYIRDGKTYESSPTTQIQGIFRWFGAGIVWPNEAVRDGFLADIDGYQKNYLAPVVNGGFVSDRDVGKQLSMTRLVITGSFGRTNGNLVPQSCGSDMVISRWYAALTSQVIPNTTPARRGYYVSTCPHVVFSRDAGAPDSLIGVMSMNASMRYSPSLIYLRNKNGGAYYTNRFFDAGDFAVLSPSLVASRHSITCASLYWCEAKLRKTTDNTR